MRNNRFKDIKRIVVKVGTSSLTYDTGKLNLSRIEELVRVIADLMNSGKEIVLVSSGAVGAGVGKLALKEKPTSTRHKQALAAIGQASLVSIYEKIFSEYGYNTAQVLLTKFILDDDFRYQSAKNAFNTMTSYGVIPIVNENDVISTYEIEFGDNDTLSAYVAELIEADLLIILSDIDGLYDSNPNINPNAKIIPVVDKINDEILMAAGGAGSKRGTGGMKTKLHAAKIANAAGVDMVITNGAYPKRIYKVLDGESVGTLFCKKKRNKNAE